jgi:RNA polymerase sigma-70 factor (ECF subfamily)
MFADQAKCQTFEAIQDEEGGGSREAEAAAHLSATPSGGTSPRTWGLLVARIQEGEPQAMEELYQTFARGIRFYLCRQLGPQELDDKVHDTFLIVVEAIQRGEVREPDRLMGFVRTIVRRQVAAYIDDLVQSRREEVTGEAGDAIPDSRRNPEQNLAFRQKVELMKGILRGLGDRDREILTRFYLYEESQEEICRDMDLSENQFRLLKSRAKARFSVIGRRKLQRTKLMHVFLRASARAAH